MQKCNRHKNKKNLDSFDKHKVQPPGNWTNMFNSKVGFPLPR